MAIMDTYIIYTQNDIYIYFFNAVFIIYGFMNLYLQDVGFSYWSTAFVTCQSLPNSDANFANCNGVASWHPQNLMVCPKNPRFQNLSPLTTRFESFDFWYDGTSWNFKDFISSIFFGMDSYDWFSEIVSSDKDSRFEAEAHGDKNNNGTRRRCFHGLQPAFRSISFNFGRFIGESFQKKCGGGTP